LASNNKGTDYALSLLSAADQYYRKGIYSEAESLILESLNILYKVVGKEDELVIAALNNLASMYHFQGKYSDSEKIYLQLLEIQAKKFGRQDLEYALILGNLAALYRDMGNYSLAMNLNLQVLEVRRKKLGESNLDYAHTLSNIGSVLFDLGDFREAEGIFLKVLQVRKQLLGTEHPDYASTLNLLAQVYRASGNYSEAISMQIGSLKIRKEKLGNNHPSYAVTLNNLGDMYGEIGDNLSASKYLRQALEIRAKTIGTEHPDYVITLGNIAGLLLRLGDDTEAEKCFEEVRRIRRKVLGTNHPQYAMSLNSLANLYLRKNNYTKAEKLYLEAIDIFSNTLGQENLKSALVLQSLATLYYRRKSFDKAESNCLQSLKMYRKLEQNNLDVANLLDLLASIYVTTNRESKALELEQMGMKIDDEIIGQVFSIGSERQRLMYLATLQGHLHHFLSLFVEYFQNSENARQIAIDLVSRRKAIGVEIMTSERRYVLTGKYPELKSRLIELYSLRTQIANKTLTGPRSDEQVESYAQELSELTRQKENLEMELASNIPEIRTYLMNIASSMKEISRNIPVDWAIIEFIKFDLFDFDTQCSTGLHYLGIIVRGQSSKIVNLGKSEVIEKLVISFIRAITQDPDERANITIGSELRSIVFDPFIDTLTNCETILLAPDGNLTTLPFEVLPTDNTGRRLIDTYNINYVSSSRDLLQFNREASHTYYDNVIIADPDFDLQVNQITKAAEPSNKFTTNNRYPFKPVEPLNTKEEAEGIATIFKVEPIIGKDALKSRVKALRSPNILHVSTHGIFLSRESVKSKNTSFYLGSGDSGDPVYPLSGISIENSMLHSGLALSGYNTKIRNNPLPDEAEDGFLTAEDVAFMDLFDTKLVTLSACETGLGDVLIGEGVFGLRRAFVLAGSKTLIMSLWKVPADETKELMLIFYEILKSEKNIAQAFYNARLIMRKKHPDPFYWGGFIFQGDSSASI